MKPVAPLSKVTSTCAVSSPSSCGRAVVGKHRTHRQRFGAGQIQQTVGRVVTGVDEFAAAHEFAFGAPRAGPMRRKRGGACSNERPAQEAVRGMDPIDVPQQPILNAGLDLLHRFREDLVVGAHERDAARLNGYFDLLGFVHSQAERLFDEDVLLGLSGSHRGLFVEVVRQTNVHRVYTGVLQELVVVRVDLGPAYLRCTRLCGCFHHIRNGDHFCAVAIGVPAARVAVANAAAPDNTNT